VAVDPIGDTLADALVRHVPLRFTYRTAAGSQATRTVDPYAVVQRRGAWYLVARDHDRDAQRAFRLDRVEGRIVTAGEPGAYDPPEDLDPAAAVAGPDADRVEVELAVAPAARWAVEARGGQATGSTTEDGVGDPARPGHGPHPRPFLVARPRRRGRGPRTRDDLRTEVAATLRAIADAHAEVLP
jgi:predicted DNA-binding transcriptional regulator YafY